MHKREKFITISFLTCAILLLLIICLNLFVMQIEVPSESMLNTIPVGSKMLVLRNSSGIVYGDLVVFHSDEMDEVMIKRLIGMPGDTVDIREGTVYVNGEYLDESYISSYDDYSGTFFVPEDSYFFLGDNRANSKDSRYWKNPYIHKSSIIGKAIMFLSPLRLV